MKNAFSALLLMIATLGAIDAKACYQCGGQPMPHASYQMVPQGGYGGGGMNFAPAYGVGVGRFGVVRPAWFGPYGRYPKLGFAAPVRRSLGLPGFTPVRQFAFGRGAIRRVNRRAFLFGRRF